MKMENAKDRKHGAHDDAEEVKEILSAVSTEVPALIKNILASVFSEEAGRSMGKAAAAFYKELTEGGIPKEQALEMTENYMQTFSGVGDLLKKSLSGRDPDIVIKRHPKRELDEDDK
jgi:hypothetical protein